jgi:hypothetical protein
MALEFLEKMDHIYPMIMWASTVNELLFVNMYDFKNVC